jgi:broad specificity phosphatase PhoE
MSVKQVYIVRHGETDYNVAHRWQGQLQIPLNATGRTQAAALRDMLRDTDFAAVYSSDLVRASETARIIAEPHGLSIRLDPRLREYSLGIFQGKIQEQIDAQFPHEVSQWSSSDAYAIPGGESRLTTRWRGLAAWRAVMSEAAGERVMLVAHGGILRQFLPMVLNDRRYQSVHFSNTSLTRLERVRGDIWQVVTLNARPHLNS